MPCTSIPTAFADHPRKCARAIDYYPKNSDELFYLHRLVQDADNEYFMFGVEERATLGELQAILEYFNGPPGFRPSQLWDEQGRGGPPSYYAIDLTCVLAALSAPGNIGRIPTGFADNKSHWPQIVARYRQHPGELNYIRLRVQWSRAHHCMYDRLDSICFAEMEATVDFFSFPPPYCRLSPALPWSAPPPPLSPTTSFKFYPDPTTTTLLEFPPSTLPLPTSRPSCLLSLLPTPSYISTFHCATAMYRHTCPEYKEGEHLHHDRPPRELTPTKVKTQEQSQTAPRSEYDQRARPDRPNTQKDAHPNTETQALVQASPLSLPPLPISAAGLWPSASLFNPKEHFNCVAPQLIILLPNGRQLDMRCPA
ncbi:hypothetical protein DACRYDRAFT_116082 [Dacryopinax primogenitus]|uniref:Uncharacterized protein n=1 Tax=Dacryopinax primogenitus (strain DJM 731) TaxID=1858805 RepID=M5G0V4_DACPD|nr:uncharacterized protein DACRYDRAFT_116082 [Dacryopinax primogenitus]EJU02374.1 hypothetical protein DACRYDRAFT_116082 [Dacryopinax primogenitus]